MNPYADLRALSRRSVRDSLEQDPPLSCEPYETPVSSVTTLCRVLACSGLNHFRFFNSANDSMADHSVLQAYELSVLTGTQVLLLVVSETGLVYTFTTPKLQPLVTKAEGKNLIQVRQACYSRGRLGLPTPARRSCLALVNFDTNPLSHQ